MPGVILIETLISMVMELRITATTNRIMLIALNNAINSVTEAK